jgi:peptidylprolyl isomerase
LTFNKGSLILVDYTAKVKDTDEVFETTIEAEAKKHSIHDANVKYQPKLVSVGESWVIKGLDEALANSKVGDKTSVEVTPDKGFGERDSGKVRMIALRKLGEDADKVSVGDTVEIDQKTGIIRFIGSGRVQVDYNHRFAGKTILYEVNVLKALETDDEKINGMLKRHLPVDDSKLVFKKTGTSLDITIPEELFRSDGLQVMKHFIQSDIFKFIPTLEKINFLETHLIKSSETQKKEESKPNTEKPVAQKVA